MISDPVSVAPAGGSSRQSDFKAIFETKFSELLQSGLSKAEAAAQALKQTHEEMSQLKAEREAAAPAPASAAADPMKAKTAIESINLLPPAMPIDLKLLRENVEHGIASKDFAPCIRMIGSTFYSEDILMKSFSMKKATPIIEGDAKRHKTNADEAVMKVSAAAVDIEFEKVGGAPMDVDASTKCTGEESKAGESTGIPEKGLASQQAQAANASSSFDEIPMVVVLPNSNGASRDSEGGMKIGGNDIAEIDIDIDAVENMYSTLFDTDNEAVRNAMCQALGTLAMSMQTRASGYDKESPDTLKPLIIALESPLMLDPSPESLALLKGMTVTYCKLPLTLKTLLCDWIAQCAGEERFKRYINMLRQYTTIKMYEEEVGTRRCYDMA
jgi:hypothetical protein